MKREYSFLGGMFALALFSLFMWVRPIYQDIFTDKPVPTFTNLAPVQAEASGPAVRSITPLAAPPARTVHTYVLEGQIIFTNLAGAHYATGTVRIPVDIPNAPANPQRY